MKTKTRRQAVLLTVPRRTPISKVRQIIENPVKLTEDEADYQLSMAAIREGGKPIPLAVVLKKYGRR